MALLATGVLSPAALAEHRPSSSTRLAIVTDLRDTTDCAVRVLSIRVSSRGPWALVHAVAPCAEHAWILFEKRHGQWNIQSVVSDEACGRVPAPVIADLHIDRHSQIPCKPSHAANRRVTAAGDRLRLSATGLGPLHFGMTIHQAQTASHRAITGSPGPNACTFWKVAGMPSSAASVIALHGRLAYVLLYDRSIPTTRGVRVGDGITQLRHRYRGRLGPGRSAALDAAQQRLFTRTRARGRTYELEFDINRRHISFISAGSRHVIQTFGECA